VKQSIAYLFSGLLLFSGCNNPQKSNEANFKAAINEYLIKNGKTCIPISRPFPFDIPIANLNETAGPVPEMAALERVGLLKSTNTTAVVHGMLDALHGSRPPQPVKRYELSADGQKYFQQYPTAIGQSGGFCYGQKEVNSIVKWDELVKQGESSVTSVTYTYRIENLANWTRQPDVEQAFPIIKTTLDQAGTNQTAEAHLTNKGWEIDGF
jgi:hypothetical protein